MSLNSKPLVSIVLSTYNGEKYLEAQLDTLIHQTYPNLEILVLDDGSKDNTREILLNYKVKYPEIRIEFNEKNLGYIKNFEKGFLLSKGEFISFCDQDDVWDLKKTEILMNEIGDKPLIFCDVSTVNADMIGPGTRQSELVNTMSVDSCLYFLVSNVVAGNSLMVRRDLLVKAYPFPESVPHDLWCCFQATFHGGIKYHPVSLLKWRRHPQAQTGAWKEKKERIKETIHILNTFYAHCPDIKQYEKKVIGFVLASYQSFSFLNNLNRVYLFLRYQKFLLGFKKRNKFRKFLYCFKMFYEPKLHG